MVKIFALDYYRLQNAKHCALMDFIERSFDLFPVVPETFPRAVALFLAALENEHHAMHHIDRQLQSAEIHSADVDRINHFRIFRDMAKLKLRDKDKAVVAAAETIVNVSNAFGGSEIKSQSVESRSGNLLVFIQRLENDYYDDVVTLELQPFLELLKEANLLYQQNLSERVYTDAEYGKRAVKRARANCDFTLKTLFSLVNDEIRLGKGEALIPFVNYINVEIDSYRISLGQGPGGRRPKRHSKAEKEGTEDAEESDVDVEVNEK